MKTSWSSARVEILSRAEIILGYMDTKTRVENKNVLTLAELRHAICSIFISHDINENHW